MTPFSEIFETFLSLITDDLYSIYDEKDTEEDLTLLLRQAVPRFEFPRTPIIPKIDFGTKEIDLDLDLEEINIIANLMMELWLRRKIADQRVIQLEYGDKDFSLKSQGSHLKALNDTMAEIKKETYYMQRMYNRRTKAGQPNYDGLAGGAISASRE